MSRAKGKLNKNHIKKISLICKTCGKFFEVYPSVFRFNEKRGSKTYCSAKCSYVNREGSFKRGIEHPNYKTGETAYRNLALKAKGYICEKCNYDGKEFPSLIWVHHKDFERRNKNRNNNLENLEVLCVRCHMEKHLSSGEKYKGGFNAVSVASST